ISMLRQRVVFSFVLLAGAAACQGTDSTSPIDLTTAQCALADKGGSTPGTVGGPSTIVGSGRLKGCIPQDPQYGTAIIGPSGGELIVGTHRLIVPPGALTETVQIS